MEVRHTRAILFFTISVTVFLVAKCQSDISKDITKTGFPSHADDTNRRQQVRNLRKLSNRANVEDTLARSRSSILRAMAMRKRQNQNTSSVSIYKNEALFQRSYKEMERKLKIYVYKEGLHPIFHTGPCENIYSTEGYFIHNIEKPENSFVTEDAEQAHLFFLPFSVVYIVEYVLKPLRMRHTQTNIVRDYVRLVGEKYPYWNRSLGADHFMVSCHDWAPKISATSYELARNSIRVLCNANVSEGFKPSRDASMPEMKSMRVESVREYNGKPASQRNLLGFFAGRRHGYLRSVLLDQWVNRDPDLLVFEKLANNITDPKEEFHSIYSEYMSRAKYCLCPSGFEVASPRIVEAIYFGCVPVLINWNYTVPFSDVLNWDVFSITVPPQDIPKLKSILMAISRDRYFELQRNVLAVQKHFKMNEKSVPQDMFHMILHSIWLRRLNFRVKTHTITIQ